jgi:hypothetical protein
LSQRENEAACYWAWYSALLVALVVWLVTQARHR